MARSDRAGSASDQFPPRRTNPRSARTESASSKPAKSRASRKSTGRPAGPRWRTQRRRTALARPLLGLAEELEEDRQLGPVIELAREQRERVGVQDEAQLVLGEPEELHEARRALGHRVCESTAAWRDPLRTPPQSRMRRAPPGGWASTPSSWRSGAIARCCAWCRSPFRRRGGAILDPLAGDELSPWPACSPTPRSRWSSTPGARTWRSCAASSLRGAQRLRHAGGGRLRRA